MLDAALPTRLDAHNPAGDLGCCGYRVGWIVACTHPHAEHWANANLIRRGYRTYLPLVTVRRRDRVVPSLSRTIAVPLFANYLFVHYDSRDPRRPIRETPGVRDLIRCGSEIQWAPEAAVSALQALDAERAIPYQESAKLAPGTLVAVSRGALAGWPAVVTSVSRDTANVAVMMFGALREVSVQLDCLTRRDD